MSVRGEFERILDDCLTQLDSSHPPARWLINSLVRAREHAIDDVSEAAGHVLDIEPEVSAARGNPGFDTRKERQDFDETFEHLTAICRVVVGR